MKLILIATMLMGVLCSCNNNKMMGKIENRNGNYYLVNTSKTKVYQFTVKGTSSMADSVIEYKTFTEILSPGEERLIGQTKDTVADPLRILIPSEKINSANQTIDISHMAEVTGQVEIFNSSKYVTEKSVSQ